MAPLCRRRRALTAWILTPPMTPTPPRQLPKLNQFTLGRTPPVSSGSVVLRSGREPRILRLAIQARARALARRPPV